MAQLRIITAKFPGVCKHCGGGFKAGTKIQWAPGESYHNYDCKPGPYKGCKGCSAGPDEGCECNRQRSYEVEQREEQATSEYDMEHAERALPADPWFGHEDDCPF